MKFVRSFPFRPTPESCSLTDFTEGTGTNGFLIDAIRTLYEVPNKPENPIEWLRLYFKSQMAESASEEQEPTDLEELEDSLVADLVGMESKLLTAYEVEAQNQAIIGKLEHELNNTHIGSAKSHQYEDLRKYQSHPEDYHYRIRPSPSYQPSKSDMLLEEDDDGAGVEGMTATVQESLVELLPVDSGAFDNMGSEAGGKKIADVGKMYDDYEEMYFPTQTIVKESPVVEEMSGGGSNADGEEENESSEGDTSETSYPGESESTI